jgi:DNA helicase-2/ATP-dependent DNA helicase PcrA
MLALLRFVENPRDRVAGFRVMQLMPGVGPTSAQRVLDRMMEAADPIGALAGLTELTLDPPDATSDQAGVPLLDEDYLILSTIHSAKGQEWKSVFVLNVVDGCIPSDLGTGTSAEIEEERRLLYVAMTRAKDDLHLITPQRFFTHGQNAQGDRHVYASRTRFIPDGLLGLFERTAWPMAAPGPAVRPASEGVRVDVGARMRGMWR